MPKTSSRAVNHEPVADADDEAPFLWHHDLHERIAEEVLYFMFVRTTPYEQPSLLRNVQKAFDAYHVRSFAVWELFGDRDLLLRFWLPRQESFGDFESSLKDCIQNSYGLSLEHFVVNSFECHSEWEGLKSPEAVLSLIETSDLRRPTKEIPQSRRVRYIKENLATRTGKFQTTLKVFGIVHMFDPFPEDAARASIENYRKTLADERLSGVALFRGSGVGEFFISARVARRDMELLSRSIMPAIQKNGPTYRTRTITHIASLSRPLIRREQLLPTESPFGRYFKAESPPTEQSVQRSLSEDEGTMFEAKGSVFVGVKAGARRESSAPLGRTGLLQPVLKTIVAFLNTDGGLLLIGAVEQRDYEFDGLSQKYSKAEAVGRHFIVGIQNEYKDGKWDAYERLLQSKIANKIGVAPESWIRITRVRLGESDICAIEVKASPRAFYTTNGSGEETYYKRAGGRTIQVKGPKLQAELSSRGIGRH